MDNIKSAEGQQLYLVCPCIKGLQDPLSTIMLSETVSTLALPWDIALNEVQISTMGHFSGKMQEEIMFESFHLYPGTDLGQD